MRRTYSIEKRFLAMLLSIAMIAVYLPGMVLNASAAVPAVTITDPGTAHTWESMMGTDLDGNRYAGRVWADKSVYKDGDTAVLNSKGDSTSSFEVALEDDEAFQIVFSALGSSMTTTTTTSTTGPLDVVLVLDNSDSMRTNYVGTGSARKTRMQSVIEAANSLLEELIAEGNDVRLGITAYALGGSTVLPFGTYRDGVELRVNNYTSSGVITAYNNAGQRIDRNYQSGGYELNTNIQVGFDLAMQMLEGATDTANRKPVVILLTDGAANTAVDTLFDNDKNGTVRQVYYASNIDPMIALSTLLSNAYHKADVKNHYGKAPMIYGVGVDLSNTDGSNAIINPKDNFNSANTNSNIRSAYNYYVNTWRAGGTVSLRSGGYNFSFGHEYPQGSAVTDSDVAANINYVDTYYPVASANLESVFDQIYQELSSGVFNPISSTINVEGATGVQNTPLIYVDFIGQYMEVKEIQSVSLFGSSYGLTKGTAYPDVEEDENHNDIPITVTPYTVASADGKNPATNENWNTSQDIRIRLIEYADKTQKLEIRIDQEILPILLERVDDKNINGEHTVTITEIGQSPLRVFYTVGIDSEILLPNGEIDISKIDSGYSFINGNDIIFFSNRFGVKAPAVGGVVTNGDAHVGFMPSKANRYYYHQTNQDIFTAVSRKDGEDINWQADEYGVRYVEDAFNFTWLTYENYGTLQDGHEVYTYVTYHRPVADNTTEAEQVTYLVYTNWGYLKESVAFYDHDAEVYINYHETNGYTTGEVGYAIPVDKVSATIAAYKQANPKAEIYGMLGVESLRTSRLHNMIVEKTENDQPANKTGTAVNRYSPEYTYSTAADHNGNDVVVWLGNNGKLTVDIDTGIALTKAVTEAIGNREDTYALTVTIPNGVTATPVVKDAQGNDVTSAISTYSNRVLTVNVKAGQTVYISGIPADTVCSIGEDIPDGKDYYVSSKTATVKIPNLTEVIGGAAQFAPATVTNAPNQYGALTIIKDIEHNLSDAPAAMAAKIFAFKVQLPVALAGAEYPVDKANASLFTADKIVVGNDGSFIVELKDNESITILDLPAGTAYTVTEIDVPDGYFNSTGILTGEIAPHGDHDAHFVNAYGYTAIKPEVTITGTKTVTEYGSTYYGNEDFVFELSHYVGVSATNPTGYEVLETATAKAGGSYAFQLADELTEALGIGEHYFRVTEQTGTTAGMSYDSTRGLFRVILADENADGTLEVAVENIANTTVTNSSGFQVVKNFENIYDVAKTHVDINIQKTLKNDTGVDIPWNSFHFTLVNKANANERYTATTDAAGKATIRIPELDLGIHEYEIREVEDATWLGMHYDTTRTSPASVVVTVTQEGGVLQAVTQIDGVTTNDISFVNEYQLTPIAHTISGTKNLEGKDITDGEFSFALYETDASFKLPSNAVAKETVTNTGNGFSFTKIDYTQVGTYYYSVKEVDGDKAGVTYDTTHYRVTVTVGVEGAGLKVTDVTVNKIGRNSDDSGKIAFVNTYIAEPTEYTICGTKVLAGRAMRAGEFIFELYEGNVKMGEATNKADGTFTFDAISYSKPGTYTYTVKEQRGNAPGVTYTDAEVEVTVTVTDTNAVLSAEANKTAAEIRLVNTYEAEGATVTFGGTKELKGGTLTDNTFTFYLYETDHTFDIAGKTPKEKSNVDGKFTFDTITFNTTGTYFYAVAEAAANPLENIVYDRTQHNYTVQVTDIGDGQLKAVVTNTTTGIATGSAASVTASAAFTNATFDEVTEKEVYLAGSTATHIDGQKVNAGDVLTYFITYTNYNGEAVVVDIMDVIPAHTSYVEDSASHNGTYAGEHVNWILNVDRAESVTVSFKVKVDASEAIVSNTAVVRDGVNVYTTNEVVNHTVEKPLKKDVFSSAEETSIDGKKVNAGDELRYEISFTNASGRPMDIQITDAIPANTTYVAGSADNGGVYSGGTVTWEIRDVPAWATVTVTFKVTINADAGAAEIKNVAKAADGTNSYTTNQVVNEVQVPAKPTEPTAPTPQTPQTGDNFQAVTFITLMILSSLGLAAIIICKKQEENKENAQ